MTQPDPPANHTARSRRTLLILITFLSLIVQPNALAKLGGGGGQGVPWPPTAVRAIPHSYDSGWVRGDVPATIPNITKLP